MNDHELGRRAAIDGSPAGWAALKRDCAGLPPESAFVLLRVMGERLPLSADAEAAMDNGADVAGLVVAGAALMGRAVRIRGMDTADQVDDNAWGSYLTARNRAGQLLRQAVIRQPANGLAAAWLMAAAVDSDAETKAEAAAALGRTTNVPISGYSRLLSAHTEKWGGSHEAMWQIARTHARISAPWSAALIAKAHYEHWLYLDMMDERPVAQYEADGYFRDPAIRRELLDISEAINTASSDDPYEAVFAHDVLAAVLAEAGEKRAATAHLRRAGAFGDPALLTGGPWWRRSLVRAMKGLPPW